MTNQLRYFKTFKTLDHGDLYFYGGSSNHRFFCSSCIEGRAITEMIALLIGTVFGVGLYLAGMTNSSKIGSFLDIAGTWDPSLIFVMGGRIPAAAIGFFILKKP